MRKVGAQLRAAAIDRLPIALSLLLALVATAAPSQSRPESAASRPVPKLSVRRVPFPVEGNAIVPSGCSFSPDGRFLAVATGIPRIFDFKTNQMASAPLGNPKWPPAFSPKSDRLAVTVDRGVALLRLDSGEWRHEKTVVLPFQPWVVFPCPRTLSWSQDGMKLMIAEKAQSACLVDAGSGSVRPFDCGPAKIWSGISLDERRAVVSCRTGDGYDTLVFEDARLAETWKGFAILAASADGRSWLIERKDPPGSREVDSRTSPELDELLRTHMEIWDPKTRARRARLEDLVSLAAFSGDGRILVTSDIKTVAIRDGGTGAVFHTIPHYEDDRVVALAISPDGKRLLTMGRPGRSSDGIVLWELAFE